MNFICESTRNSLQDKDKIRGFAYKYKKLCPFVSPLSFPLFFPLFLLLVLLWWFSLLTGLIRFFIAYVGHDHSDLDICKARLVHREYAISDVMLNGLGEAFAIPPPELCKCCPLLSASSAG